MATMTNPLAGVEVGELAPLSGNTVLLNIVCGMLGNSRKVSTAQVEVDADKTMLRVSKDLLDSMELKAIDQHDKAVKRELATLCTPGPFKKGIYMVPIKLVTKVRQILKDADEKRQPLIQAFMEVYRERQAEAELRLKDLYDPLNYPPEARVREAFTFKWQFLKFEAPTKMEGLSADFIEEEKAKIVAEMQSVEAVAREFMRKQWQDLVDGMVSALQPTADGKTKKFHKTTIDKIKVFIDNFRDRNITDDAELAALVNAAEQILEGSDIISIKSNEALRDNIGSVFTAIKNCMETMTVEQGVRDMELPDEDEENDDDPF